MNNKKPCYNDTDLDGNFELLSSLNRQNSELEWTKQMMKNKDPQGREATAQPDIEDGLINSNYKVVLNDPFSRIAKGHTREAESFSKMFNFAKLNGSPTNFPSLSRFNSIINEELTLDKRVSMAEEKSVDVAVIKTGESDKDHLLNVVPIDKGRLSLDDQMAPPLSRFKSNESFGVLLGRNCSAYHISENTQTITGTLCPNSEYPHFGSLLTLLKKHFKGKKIDDKDLQISAHELDVLKSIITRKYKNKINVNVKSFFLKDKLEEIDRLDSFKRPEENYKFIFKRGIKYLKERLKAFEGSRLKKRELDTYFYHYYFDEACKKYGMSIDEVQNPCNAKGVKTRLKTVNTEYITNMIKSDKFSKDFKDYMYENLHSDYEATIDSKIEALIRRWEELYNDTENKETAVQNIIDYVLKNKKCKLPWTGKEISRAMKCVEATFEECRINMH